MSEDADTVGETWTAVCQDALTVLRYALLWKLPEQHWEEVSGTVSDIARAAESGDLDLLAQSTATLEMCGPLRVGTRIGDQDNSKQPVPIAVKDQIAHTVDKLELIKDVKR